MASKSPDRSDVATAVKATPTIELPNHEDKEQKWLSLQIGDMVKHKKFGNGKVSKINKDEKFIYVKFALGEKKFIFPDAFVMGFLEVV